MKKILVGYAEDWKKSGIDRYLAGVLETAKETGVQLDFLTSVYSEHTASVLASCGSRLFPVHNLKKPHLHYRDIKEILSREKYERAYFNVSEPLNFVGAMAAHRMGLETVIHSHSSGMDIASSSKRWIRGGINALCRPILYRFGDRYFACSYRAGEWLFPKKILSSDRFHLICNAVDPKRFHPDPEARRQARQELGWEETDPVLGFVGNFCYQKNNFFLPEILKESIRINPRCKMLLVGDGTDRAAVEEVFSREGLSDSVAFLGVRQDVPRWMQAMDVFLLPSRFEGLPIVAVEAQFSGLPCLISNRVDPLVSLGESCRLLPPEDASRWAREALLLFAQPALWDDEKKALFSLENNRSVLRDLVLSVAEENN